MNSKLLRCLFESNELPVGESVSMFYAATGMTVYIDVRICKHYIQCPKNKQNYFCHIFVKFLPTLIIFCTKMANSLSLY